MARDVLIRLKKLSTTGKVPANAAVRFEPTVLRADADGYILDDYFDAVMVDGEATVTDLPETDLNWAYKVQIRGHGRGAGLKQVYATWYVHLPAGEGTVNFEDLPRIDPKTLTPVNDPDPAWVDAVTAVFSDSISTAVEPAMVTAAQDEQSQFRSALNAASVQAVGAQFVVSEDPTTPLENGQVLILLPPDRTQFFTDFTEYTVGQSPHDWGEPWSDNNPLSVVSDATGSGGVVLRESGMTKQNRAFTWDAVPRYDDVEVVFKWRTDHVAVPRALVRADGTATAPVGYHAGAQNASTLSIQAFDASTTSVDLANGSTSISTNTWYVTRFRVIGNALSMRTWAASDPEPTAWDLQATDSTLPASGLVGIRDFSTGGVREFDWFGAALLGETAPTGVMV